MMKLSHRQCLVVLAIMTTTVTWTYWVNFDSVYAGRSTFSRRHLTSQKPHIVFILADDLGWNDVGYHGSEVKTPNLDALAESGVKLENYYVQHCCGPTRGQLMTGRYQIHTGLQTSKMMADSKAAIPLKFPILAQKMKENGYATHMVGKWHLGFHSRDYLPTHRGFDSHYGYYCAAEDYFTHMLHGFLDFHHNERNLWNQTGYSTELFRDHTIKLIETHAASDEDQPLFMYLAFQAVHSPLQVPDKYMESYDHIADTDRRTYAGMVTALDEAVADITKSLKDQGLWDNTLLIFSTDNGATPAYGGSNYPLRGKKGTFFEGGIRGVSFVSGPFLSRGGATSHEVMHVTDWFPTLVGLAGGNTSGMGLDGYDIWNVLSVDAKAERREILHHINPIEHSKGVRRPDSPFDNHFRAALRVDNWKILTGNPGRGDWVAPPGHVNVTLEMARDSKKNIWLFDISQDPEERRDLSDERPDIVMEMLEKLAGYDATAVHPLIFTSDPAAQPVKGGAWEPWL